jgi:hypothetical protein
MMPTGSAFIGRKVKHVNKVLTSVGTSTTVIFVRGDAPDREGVAMTVTEQKQSVKVGDILVRSWGYDQTNVDFYEVVKTTEKTVWFISIGQTKTDGSFRGHVLPNREVRGTEVLRRKNKSGWHGQVWIDVNSYAGATLWDGQGQYFSQDR